MRWTVNGERPLYESDWMTLSLVDVEPPGHRRFEQHVLRMPRPAAGTIVHDPDRDAVLLLWRHRFITDQWGWEIPAGGMDEGEVPEEAAIRETVEEAGWRPGTLERVAAYAPMPGAVDQTFHVFLTRDARYVGDPTDPTESERVEWVPVSTLREAIVDGRIVEGMSLTGISLAFATGRLG